MILFSTLTEGERKRILQWLRERGWTIIPGGWRSATATHASHGPDLHDVEGAVLLQVAMEQTAETKDCFR